MSNKDKTYEELKEKYMNDRYTKKPEQLKNNTPQELATKYIAAKGFAYQNQLHKETLQRSNAKIRNKIKQINNPNIKEEELEKVAEKSYEGKKTIGEFVTEYERTLYKEKYEEYVNTPKDAIIDKIIERNILNTGDYSKLDQLRNTNIELSDRMENLQIKELSKETKNEAKKDTTASKKNENIIEADFTVIEENAFEPKKVEKQEPELSPEEKKVKKQMKEELKNVNKEDLLDQLFKSAYETHLEKGKNSALEEQVELLKEQNRELRKENLSLRTKMAENGISVEHQTSKSKVNLTSKLLNAAKEKVSKFFTEALQKGLDKGEDFVLERKKNYHNRFQKSRALLKSANELVLKPAAKFTKKQFKESQKKVEMIHDKVRINLNQDSNFKPNAVDYTAKFVAVSTTEAGRKLYQVSGAKKVVDTTLNSETANKIKNAYDKATTSYNENVEVNKAKAQAVENRIEEKAEAKKQKQKAL